MSTTLSDYGAGIERDPGPGLHDLQRMLLVAHIPIPSLPNDDIPAWRPPDVEIAERVYRSSLAAVQHACPGYDFEPEPYPPDVDYSFEARQEPDVTQATLDVQVRDQEGDA